MAGVVSASESGWGQGPESAGRGRMTTCMPRARVRRMMVAKLGLPLGERAL